MHQSVSVPSQLSEKETIEMLKNRIIQLRRCLCAIKNAFESKIYKRREPNPRLLPIEWQQIQIAEDGLKDLHRQFAEAGGVYEKSRIERQKDAFNNRLAYAREIIFTYGSFFDGFTIRTFHFDGSHVSEDIRYQPSYKKEQQKLPLEISRKELLTGLAKLDLIDWRTRFAKKSRTNVNTDGLFWSLRIVYSGGKKSYFVEGCNHFPWNFEKLVSLLGERQQGRMPQ